MEVIAKPKFRFAHRTDLTEANAVREILKVTEHPEIISFAGGLPAPELFPTAEMERAFSEVLLNDGGAALQYSVTEGFLPLREWISARLAGKGAEVSPSDILITAGSQQGIDLAARVLLDPGDSVLVEQPTYLAAIQVFRSYEASFCCVSNDEQGMRVDEAEEAIKRAQPKLIYLVPNFQNPAGTTLSLERRYKLIELSQKYGVPIVEDDPYGELRYRGDHLPPLKALDEDGLVISISTFSKSLCPGLRVAWMIAPPQIYQKLVVAKQAADLHSSTLSQRAIYNYLLNNSYEDRLSQLCAVYGERCQSMLDSLEELFPKEVKWTRPEGGMFLWVELPEEAQAESVFKEALQQRVAFVPGAPFYPEDPKHNFFRLNFSNQTPARIREGIRRLASVIERCL